MSGLRERSSASGHLGQTWGADHTRGSWVCKPDRPWRGAAAKRLDSVPLRGLLHCVDAASQPIPRAKRRPGAHGQRGERGSPVPHRGALPAAVDRGGGHRFSSLRLRPLVLQPAGRQGADPLRDVLQRQPFRAFQAGQRAVGADALPTVHLRRPGTVPGDRRPHRTRGRRRAAGGVRATEGEARRRGPVRRGPQTVAASLPPPHRHHQFACWRRSQGRSRRHPAALSVRARDLFPGRRAGLRGPRVRSSPRSTAPSSCATHRTSSC